MARYAPEPDSPSLLYPQRPHPAHEGSRLRRGLRVDPDTADGFSGADYLPDGVERRPLYEPTANGHERRIRERLAHWEGLRARKR